MRRSRAPSDAAYRHPHSGSRLVSHRITLAALRPDAIEIGAGSRVDRGLHIQPNSGGWFSFFFPRTPPRIVIGPEAVVSGTLRFEQEVTLYVSDHARIGPVQGATPIRFSGAQPPD